MKAPEEKILQILFNKENNNLIEEIDKIWISVLPSWECDGMHMRSTSYFLNIKTNKDLFHTEIKK